MNPETVKLVQQSWARITPIAPQAAVLFYTNLFTLDSSLRPLFRGDMETQGEKLVQMINTTVARLDWLEALVPIWQGLAVRHAAYGVKDIHYRTVREALLTTLSQGLGDEFTDAVRDAWIHAYDVMATIMIDAALADAAL